MATGIDQERVYERLLRLQPSQLDEVVFRLRMPDEHLPRGTKAERALAIIQAARALGILHLLEAELDRHDRWQGVERPSPPAIDHGEEPAGPLKLPDFNVEHLSKKLARAGTAQVEQLDALSDVFGDPLALARLYVEPDCQQFNPADAPDEVGNELSEPVFTYLRRKFLRGHSTTPGDNQLFVLSDAGMGKTSLLLMLRLSAIAGHWPAGYDCILLKLGPDTLDRVASISGRRRKVLLLDALDEDVDAWGRIPERLAALLHATRTFHRVILTCRTQFFVARDDPFDRRGRVAVAGLLCPVVYLSLFSEEQVAAYLKKRFPDDARRRKQAQQDVLPRMDRLRCRPMLLAHIEDLLDSQTPQWTPYSIYAALIGAWLDREHGKRVAQVGLSQAPSRERLLIACQHVALHLHTRRGPSPSLQLAELEALIAEVPELAEIPGMDVGGRSLLNRDSQGRFRFSHRSFQEFLLVQGMVAGRFSGVATVHHTDEILRFLASIPYHVDRSAVRWRLLDLSGARLAGLSLRGADLSDTEMVEADFRGCDLRGADLRWAAQEGARWEGVIYDDTTRWQEGGAPRQAIRVGPGARLDGLDLNGWWFAGADLRDASLVGARLDGADLQRAKLADADLQRADLRGALLQDATLDGADLREARLDGVRLRKASLVQADLRDLDLADADLRSASLRYANLCGADLRRAQLKDANLEGVSWDASTRLPPRMELPSSALRLDREGWQKTNDLTDRSLQGARLAGLDLSQTDLRGARLGGADLSGATLSLQGLEGADLSGAVLRGAQLLDAEGVSRRPTECSEVWTLDHRLRFWPSTRSVGRLYHPARLRGADLSSVDLRRIDLSRLEIVGVILSGALVDAHTRWPKGYAPVGAWMIGPLSDLRGADLRGRDLRNADLRGADLRGGRLQGAQLQYANLSGADLRDTDLTGPGDPRLEGIHRPGVVIGTKTGEIIVIGSLSPHQAASTIVLGPMTPEPARDQAPDPALLASAFYTEETRWPEGFDPRPAGARLVSSQVGLACRDPRMRMLRGVVVTDADLQADSLDGWDLRGADLGGVRGWAWQFNHRVLFDETTVWPSDMPAPWGRSFQPGADLRGLPLNALDLAGVDLAGANLRDASFAGTDLREARLNGCLLFGADLREAMIHGALLTGALFDPETRWPDGFDAEAAGARRLGPGLSLVGLDLRECDLSRLQLQGSDLTLARLDGATLTGANLERAILAQASLVKAVLDDALLPGADLTEADLSGVSLNGADLRQACLARAQLAGVQLERACLAGARLRDLELVDAKMHRPSLEGANLRDASIQRGFFPMPWLRSWSASTAISDLYTVSPTYTAPRLDGADLSGARLPNADLNGVDLRGADLSGSRLAETQLEGARHDATTRWPPGFKAPPSRS